MFCPQRGEHNSHNNSEEPHVQSSVLSKLDKGKAQKFVSPWDKLLLSVNQWEQARLQNAMMGYKVDTIKGGGDTNKKRGIGRPQV